MKTLIIVTFLTFKIASVWSGGPVPVETTIAPPSTVPTEPSPIFRCGDSVDFSLFNPSESTVPGLASGTWVDGSTVYPGSAVFWCGGKRPARINANSGIAYQTCYDDDQSTNEVKYFANVGGLAWKTTNYQEMDSVPGAIQTLLGDDWHNYFVIRVNVTISGNVYQQIGLKWVEGPNIAYYDGTQTISNPPEVFDILVCPVID